MVTAKAVSDEPVSDEPVSDETASDEAVSDEAASDEAAEELVRQAVAASPDAVIVVDAEGTVIYWNAGAERIFGYPAEQAVGGTLDIIIPERLRERHWTGFGQAVASGRSRYSASDLLAVPAVTADGRTVSIEFTVSLVTSGGAVTAVGAILRDVTERRAREMELRRRVADLEAEVSTRTEPSAEGG